MRVYSTSGETPTKAIGLGARKQALFPTTQRPLIRRQEEIETIVYASDGVYRVDEPKNRIRRLILKDSTSSWEEDCDQHSLIFDKSYWQSGDIAHHLPLDYKLVEIKREQYFLPEAPSVGCVIESRNGIICDMYYSCKPEVPITSIVEDISHFISFFRKHCVGSKS